MRLPELAGSFSGRTAEDGRHVLHRAKAGLRGDLGERRRRVEQQTFREFDAGTFDFIVNGSAQQALEAFIER